MRRNFALLRAQWRQIGLTFLTLVGVGIARGTVARISVVTSAL